jgi:phosphate transport system substrate-binding protein
MQSPSALYGCLVLSIVIAAAGCKAETTHARPATAGVASAPAAGAPGVQGVEVDPTLPSYKAVQGVSGELKSMGSDTMNQEMTNWVEGFKSFYPNVTPGIVGKGSSEAPTALIEGTAQFGPMSRPMKADEIDKFEKKFGYKPTALPTSIDMLAVYVHKDNPIASLTLQQVDAIFSKTRKGGHDKEIRTWGELGLTGEWEQQPISLYGRNSLSGTYGYFKEHALFKGDFKDSVKEQPGSSTVVQGVATDKYAIGYSGIGYRTADVRAVPLAAKPAGKPVDPTADNAYSGAYPLSRFLFVYVNYKPGSTLDPLRAEFIRYMFSKEGQMVVVKLDFFPIRKPIADKALKSVGLGDAAAEEKNAGENEKPR